MEVANLSVAITGDTAGLISSLDIAEEAIKNTRESVGTLSDDMRELLSGFSVNNYNRLFQVNPAFEAAKADLEHYKKTHHMSMEEEITAWQEIGKVFANNPYVLDEVEEALFQLHEKAVKAKKNADDKALADYKKTSDKWIEYETKVNDMSVENQIAAYKRQKESYNAMVSEMVKSSLYSSEEIKVIWDEFYDYASDVDLKIGLLDKSKKKEIYENWQAHAKGWVTIRDLYNDWEQSGDSKIKFYTRSIDKIKEMYDAKNIPWQQYRDDTMEGTLNLYKAKMEQVDKLLGYQSKYIRDTKTKFSDEEKALKDSWTSSDRKSSMDEVGGLLKIYDKAVTQRGKDKYASLEEEMKRLKREEKLYEMEKEHTAIIKNLEADYERVEENKEYLLGVIENSQLDVEKIVSGARYDISSMQKTLTSLFNQTISAIKDIQSSSNSYSDNRRISITTNSKGEIDSLKNNIIGAIAHGNFY